MGICMIDVKEIGNMIAVRVVVVATAVAEATVIVEARAGVVAVLAAIPDPEAGLTVVVGSAAAHLRLVAIGLQVALAAAEVAG